MLRVANAALAQGIASVATLREAIDAVLALEEALRAGRGRVARLADWFRPKEEEELTGPL